MIYMCMRYANQIWHEDSIKHLHCTVHFSTTVLTVTQARPNRRTCCPIDTLVVSVFTTHPCHIGPDWRQQEADLGIFKIRRMYILTSLHFRQIKKNHIQTIYWSLKFQDLSSFCANMVHFSPFRHPCPKCLFRFSNLAIALLWWISVIAIQGKHVGLHYYTGTVIQPLRSY